jgi:hypothetical protein
VKESELEVYNSVTKTILPDLAESAKKGARGNLLYNPPSSVIPPAPRGGSDPYGAVPGMNVKPNTDPYSANPFGPKQGLIK